MAESTLAAFSSNGKYFSLIGADGKLRIWETDRNSLKHEFTPNMHLTSPCTSLLWTSFSRDRGAGKPSKKKKRKSLEEMGDFLAMGTSNGGVMLYSIATANVETTLHGGHGNHPVRGLSWHPGTSLYSCGSDTIVQWNVQEKRSNSKWKTGTDQVRSVLVSPDEKWVLSASRSIKLWNAKSHELLQTFTGHSSPIFNLTYVPNQSPSGDTYFLSMAEGDRYVNVWTLNKSNNEKSAVVAMVLENEPVGTLAIHSNDSEWTINVAASSRIGSLQLFSHQLNGRCVKPLKPNLTVQVATDVSRGKESVEPIPIVSAVFTSAEEMKVAYGYGSFLTFENVILNPSEKLQVLIRQDPRRLRVGKSDEESSMVRVPDTQNAVYVSSSSVNPVLAGSKRSHARREVPMEERLENLSLSVARSDDKVVSLPRADNLSQLLLQALQSKERGMLNTVLMRREEEVIKNTVRRLPVQVIEPLLRELTSLFHAKTATAQAAARWMRVVLSTHAAHLMANPSLTELFAPILGLVESRLTLLPALNRLSGRLELLTAQLDSTPSSEDVSSAVQSSLLLYQDADTSDEENSIGEQAGLGSESDDHWEELSSSDEDERDHVEQEEEEEEEDTNEDDAQMSD